MLALRQARLLRPSLRPCCLPRTASAYLPLSRALLSTSTSPRQVKPEQSTKDDAGKPGIELHENIYTIPNALTVSRIIACPFLGYFIVKGDFVNATWLLAYAGISDWVSSSD